MSASEQDVAVAFKALLQAQLDGYGATGADALDLDEARGVNVDHVQVTLTQRFSGSERAGVADQHPYRATTRPVAAFIASARDLNRRADLALKGARLVVGSETSTPIRLESQDAIGEDDGKYSGLTTWTFTL